MRQKPPVGFKDLPIELVLEIVRYLSELDHLCLALTCKSLLNLLDGSKTLQRSPKFKDTSGLPPLLFACSRYSYDKLQTDRWKLLRRLEDSYWRRCSACVRLHPFYEFSDKDLKTASCKRTCVAGSFGGVVRLCPCLVITFRDKMRLVKRLRSESGTERYKLHNEILESMVSTGQHQCCHSYKSKYESERTKVQIQLKLILEKNNRFMVESDYKITGTVPSDNFEDTIALLCPHRRLTNHLRELERQHSMYGNRHQVWQYHNIHGRVWKFSKNVMSCPWCRTTSSDAQWSTRAVNTTKDEDIHIFTVRRHLGNAMRKANYTWYQQTETAFEAIPFDKRLTEGYNWVSWISPKLLEYP